MIERVKKASYREAYASQLFRRMRTPARSPNCPVNLVRLVYPNDDTFLRLIRLGDVVR